MYPWGSKGYLNNIPVLNSPVIYVLDKPANTPSIAPPLPCETHPSRRISITLVGSPTEREAHHYARGKLIEDFWIPGRRGDCRVCVFCNLGFMEYHF